MAASNANLWVVISTEGKAPFSVMREKKPGKWEVFGTHGGRAHWEIFGDAAHEVAHLLNSEGNNPSTCNKIYSRFEIY